MEEIFWKIFEKTGNISSYLVYSEIKNNDGVEGDGKSEKTIYQDSENPGSNSTIY